MKKLNRIPVVSTAFFFAAGLPLLGCSEPDAANSWVSAGTLEQARSGHSAVRLDNGAVLFAGGENASGLVAIAELRDTATQQWSHRGALNETRTHPAALKRGDGSAMIIGGTNNAASSSCIEIFNPKDDSFTADTSFSGDCPRQPVAASVEWATHMGVGADETDNARERIVITNGDTGEVHLFNPESSTWSSSGQFSMLAQRAGYTATVLILRRHNSILDVPDGGMASDLFSEDAAILLVVGGATDPATQPIAEYLNMAVCASNPNKCAWNAINTEGTNRRNHTATWIGNGEVLVVGGRDESNQILGTAERYQYDFDYDTWTLSSAQSLHTARYGHSATRLTDGNVLIVGGQDAGDQPIDSVEMYDVAGDTFFEMPSMSSPRAEHTATWLSDGSVLVAGGKNTTSNYLASTERFIPENTRIPCAQTKDCPRAMLCGAELYCQQSTGPLASQSACAYTGEPKSGHPIPLSLGSVLLLGAWAMRRKRVSKRCAAALAGAVLLLAPALSRAQTPTFYLDRLQIAGGFEDGAGVWRPVFGRTGVFGQAALGYAAAPLRVSAFVHDTTQARALAGSAVSLQITGYATAGIELAKRGSIQVSIPYVLDQRGYATNDRAAGLNQVVSMEPSALGDMRIDGRMLFLWNESRSLLVGARVAAFLPTGDEFSFTGEGAAWGSAGLSAEYKSDAFFLSANAGLTMRPKSSLVDLQVGSEFAYALGAFIPLKQDRVRLGAELWGALGLLSRSPEAIPLEATLSSRLALGESRRFFLGLNVGTRLGAGYAPDMRFVTRIGGVIPFEKEEREVTLPVRVVPEADTDGDGFLDADDKCPIVKEDFLREKDGCPESDEDRDGIVTSIDACPKVPEDKDGLADEDGCPEDDFDGDGFADLEDKCPKEPGVRNEDPSKLGCPQFIERTKTEVKLSKQIEFEFQSATITPSSFSILDEIAKLLKANPDIRQLSIEGHTDNAGTPEFNQALSLRRAEAVRDYLVRRAKIQVSRLSVQGFGQSKAIASNDTEAGRAKNRRVELHIGKSEGGEEKKP